MRRAKEAGFAQCKGEKAKGGLSNWCHQPPKGGF